jgi:hypothetical protein
MGGERDAYLVPSHNFLMGYWIKGSGCASDSGQKLGPVPAENEGNILPTLTSLVAQRKTACKLRPYGSPVKGGALERMHG